MMRRKGHIDFWICHFINLRFLIPVRAAFPGPFIEIIDALPLLGSLSTFDIPSLFCPCNCAGVPSTCHAVFRIIPSIWRFRHPPRSQMRADARSASRALSLASIAFRHAFPAPAVRGVRQQRYWGTLFGPLQTVKGFGFVSLHIADMDVPSFSPPPRSRPSLRS